MRHRLALAALVPVVVALGGFSAAHAAPSSGTVANHGQCVSESPHPGGQGGRSVTAKSKGSCTLPLRCEENEDGAGTVTRDSAKNTVTVAGSGPGSDGSNLACAASIVVTAGDTVTFAYELGEGTSACGGGVPRVYVVIGETYYNTFDGDTDCSEADGDTITYTIPVSGTVTEVAFVYDRGDEGSVTYSDATIGVVTLNI